jgi:hypothetical protein
MVRKRGKDRFELEIEVKAIHDRERQPVMESTAFDYERALPR